MFVLIGMALLIAWAVGSAHFGEPTYQGRPLGKILQGPRAEYTPAIQALGTNALPYLLEELQAEDSAPARWMARQLNRISLGPFWHTAQNRRYRAALGIQILDTNAVPALMEMIFARPMQLTEGDPGYSAAMVLSHLASPESQAQVCDRLALALRSPDPVQRRNACFTLNECPRMNAEVEALLLAASRDTNAQVRAASIRPIFQFVAQKDSFLPPLIERLSDEEAVIRSMAIEALKLRGTNAAEALPALQSAYTNELLQSGPRRDLGLNLGGAYTFSAGELRQSIREAMRAVAPATPLPTDPP